MRENIPISSNFPTSWEAGCEQVRTVWADLDEGRGEAGPLIMRLVEGIVVAAYCRGVVFLQNNWSNHRKPDLDENGNADDRYLKAKARAVIEDTEKTRADLLEALESGELYRKYQSARELVAEAVEQTQVNWYQRDSGRSYTGLIKRTVGDTIDEVLDQTGLS